MQVYNSLKTKAVMLVLFTTLSSCMSFKYAFVSPGMVTKEELQNHNTFFTEVSNELSTERKETFETIGHGAGSWRYYPMGINKDGRVYGNGYKHKKTKAKDLIDLIETSIDIDPNMSIELDAQYAPDTHRISLTYPQDGAYILHDIPDWKDKATEKDSALSYLHRNTLKIALDHFVKKKYYKQTKVYVELKVTEDCVHLENQLIDCNKQSQKLAKELITYASSCQRETKENWLCVTSFSPAALTDFRNSLPAADRDKFDYVLIAGYTGGWPKSKLAQSKGHVPEFDDRMISFAKNTEWLNCIWFSAQGITKFNTIFNTLVKERHQDHPNWNALEFSFSTYQWNAKKMKRKLTKCPKLEVPIRSFMLDLDHKIE